MRYDINSSMLGNEIDLSRPDRMERAISKPQQRQHELASLKDEVSAIKKDHAATKAEISSQTDISSFKDFFETQNANSRS